MTEGRAQISGGRVHRREAGLLVALGSQGVGGDDGGEGEARIVRKGRLWVQS